MVLWVIVRPLTMQGEVITYYYLLHRLLGHQCPLVEDLLPHVINALDKDFTSFSLQMCTSYRCTEFVYYVSCIIGKYLNACVKALATVSFTDPGG